MDKFSQLIIEAYRNQNFRFAEETAPVDPESEIVAPSALDYPSLFSRMQSLEDDMKTKILEYLTRAQTKLKMDYNIDSELPIKFDSGIFLDTYSDNSNANTDEKIQTYFYRVFEYLINYFENEASSAATSDPTSSSVSEESSSAVITDPSTDSSSSETSATTETLSSGETTSTTSSDTSEEPANLKPTITIEVSGEEYQSPKVLKFQDNINIGRKLSNDIILKDPRISFDQASIFLDNEQWFIKDNDSANGSFINDINTRIKEPVILKKDDQIRFSTYYIKVISIDSEELNEFGNPVNNSGVGFFDNDESSTPTGGGEFGGRRR